MIRWASVSATDRTDVRDYDLRYAPTSIRLQATTGNPPTQLFAWNYTTDAVGNVAEIDQTQPSSASREYGYQDWQYFLACAAGPWNAISSTCDPVSGAPREWTYDRAGNRLTHVSPWLVDYSYQQNAGASGHTSELDTVAGNGLQWHDYAFDAAGYQSSFDLMVGGNPTYELDFTFDAAGQMSIVDASANKDASMEYDGRSFLRELAIANSPMLASTYSSEGVLHSLLRTPDPLLPSERINVLYFAGRPIGIWRKVGTSSATLTRLVTDHLGTPAASIQQAGSAVDWYGGFEPFGEDWQAGTGQDSLAKGIFLRMPGQWKDPIWSTATYPMELFYNVHRWYETGTGRYASVDPLMLHAQPDFDLVNESYRAFRANPMRYYDSLGLTPQRGPCCECPGLLWSYSGGSMGLSLIWGYSTFHGTYTCTSNPTLTVEVDGSCWSKGLQIGIGVQYDTSFFANVPAIPGAKACNADDLLENSEFMFASAKIGLGASRNSDDNTGYVSVGFTAGMGVGKQRCKTRLWKPIIIYDDPLRWAM